MKYLKYKIAGIVTAVLLPSLALAAISTVPLTRNSSIPAEYLSYANDKFGVGTTTPNGQLEVVDKGVTSSNAFAVFDIHSISATAYPFAIYIDTFSKVNPVFQTLGWSSTQGGALTGIVSGDFEIGNNSVNKLVFYTNGYQSPRMAITGTGLIGFGTTSPTQSQVTIATPMGATGSLQNLLLIASSTPTATTTLFTVNTQGDVVINSTNNASSNAGFVGNFGSTLVNMNAAGVSIARTGTSNSGQLFVQGNNNAASAGNYGGLVISTGISSTAGAGSFAALRINPTITVAQASGTGLNYQIASYDGTTASTSRGFYQMAGVGVFADNIGMGSTSPFAKLSIHANNGDLNKTLFAIGSSTATATTTLYTVDNVGHHFASSTAPTLSSCGTSPVVDGTDNGGVITTGATAGGCTATFANPFPRPPSCIVTNRSMSIVNAMTYTTSATALTITQTALGGALVDYKCGIGI